ncbi:zinc ribbon domain-containing protein [Pantoea sp. LMR881]|uniref:zinc ribbon domain-containing protein n=1 Tax=Pantoea sp. LMR881 TaxID=3014336 RepID=UPI0022AF39AB|nr:zinc ribbon domain-containing protein [Pantoea sp. LMR881]MCZ4060469.1 zinc ribbon domain-containing protein [Pantoea sp. LMR881]
MSAVCEKCQQPLMLSEGAFICSSCGAHYPAQAMCPDCQQPLEVLRACGAVDYFCRHGHGLISRKRVLFVPLND